MRCAACNNFAYDMKKCEIDDCDVKYCDDCKFPYNNICPSCMAELFDLALEQLDISFDKLKEMHEEKKYQESRHNCSTCKICVGCCCGECRR